MNVAAIRDHYDRMSVFYHALWGDHIHHGYWETGAETPERAQEKLVSRLACRAVIKPGARVLDIGCGIGGSALWLAAQLGCSVTGLTISPLQAEMAAEMAKVKGLERLVQFKVGDANHLETLLPERFDVVWVIESSEHLEDKAAFIGGCADVLNPGGTLALCAWCSGEAVLPSGHQQLVRTVCEGMLCPSLATRQEYQDWMHLADLKEIQAEDITARVAPTWDYCLKLVHRPEIQALVRMSDARTRRFVGAFGALRQAYAEGAMRYGMFTARKEDRV